MNHGDFLRIAIERGKQSTCFRRKVGAIIVSNGNIIGEGYNKVVEGCCNHYCYRDANDIKNGTSGKCFALHAEQMAIYDALKYIGYIEEGAVMYVTYSPCLECAKLILEAGISTVIYEQDYPDNLGRWLLQDKGVRLVKWAM